MLKKTTGGSLLICGIIGAFAAQASSRSIYIGSNYVSDHSPCDQTDIANTQWDAGGFISYKPDWILKNYLWANENVWASDWRPDRDYFTESNAATGYGGTDANELTYISTHGITYGGNFYASMGSSSACEVSSSEMDLGDVHSRYLFL